MFKKVKLLFFLPIAIIPFFALTSCGNETNPYANLGITTYTNNQPNFSFSVDSKKQGKQLLEVAITRLANYGQEIDDNANEDLYNNFHDSTKDENYCKVIYWEIVTNIAKQVNSGSIAVSSSKKVEFITPDDASGGFDFPQDNTTPLDKPSFAIFDSANKNFSLHHFELKFDGHHFINTAANLTDSVTFEYKSNEGKQTTFDLTSSNENNWMNQQSIFFYSNS